MLIFRNYHFSKDSGVITYLYVFYVFQCNAGQLSEMQFRVAELETRINTHDIVTFFLGGGTQDTKFFSLPRSSHCLLNL